MLSKLSTVLLFIVISINVARGETCDTATYTVTYSCGDGTVVGTLPADATATYAASFTPTMLTTSHCQAPAGYHQVGIEIWDQDGNIGGYATKTPAFTYYYTTGITIKPHYVADGSDNGATLWNQRETSGTSYTYDKSAMTWQVTLPYYGIVSGTAACSKVKPQNTAEGYVTGYIADDQNAIKNEGGRYCYCKLTEPFFSGSPWVFFGDYGSASSCASYCASSCGNDVQRNAVFRGSVFRGARP